MPPKREAPPEAPSPPADGSPPPAGPEVRTVTPRSPEEPAHGSGTTTPEAPAEPVPVHRGFSLGIPGFTFHGKSPIPDLFRGKKNGG